MSATVLAVLFAALGAAGWLTAYRAQRCAKRCLLASRPPGWAAWLCGNPRGDGTIDLENGLQQLAALVFLAGSPLSLLLKCPPHVQAGLVFVAYVAVALPGTVYVERARLCAERERNMLMDSPASRPDGFPKPARPESALGR